LSEGQAGPAEDLDDLYENAPCGYLSLRPDGRIVKVNRTFAVWTGFPVEALLLKRFRDLLNVAGSIFYETHFAPLLRMQGFFHEVALDVVMADGQVLPVLANASERRDEMGNVLFTRITLFRATDRRRYERELVDAQMAAQTARRELQALNETLQERVQAAIGERLQTEAVLRLSRQREAATQQTLAVERETAELREQFIAVLGHDLRNPVASISAAASLLLIEPQSAKSLRIIALMQGSVGRMSALIDDVLDFARGRLGGGIALTLVDDPIEPVLRQVVEELRAANPDRQINVHFAIDQVVRCDFARVGQLLSNLLANAITHGTDDAPVEVAAFTIEERFELSVANGGLPIPPPVMERLFQPFFRGEVRRSQQGLGLGLHIASEIARAHGGTLTVSSTEVETRFTLRMSLASKGTPSSSNKTRGRGEFTRS
jgi:phosphoserine phosphatase RsbU/P